MEMDPFSKDWADNFLDILGGNLNSTLPNTFDDMLMDLGPPVESESGTSCEMDQQLSPMPEALSPLANSSDASDSESSSYTTETASLKSTNTQHEKIDAAETAVKTEPKMQVRRVVRLAPLQTSADGKQTRSILVPVTSQGKTTMRTYRIVSGAGGRLPPGIKLVCSKQAMLKPPVQAQTLSSTTAEPTRHSNDSPSDSTSDDSDAPRYPRLELSTEERRLLKKEGITLPAHYPLTKQEERELKRIRRKIRNKISAQDSRKRKKEYVDGLEERVKKCSDENTTLHKKLKALQNQNNALTTQIRRLQALVAQGAGGRPVQPATCLMVLLLSLALVVVPNVRPNQPQQTTTAVEEADLLPDKLPPVAGRSRTLLFNKYEDFPSFLADADDEDGLLCSVHDHDYEPPAKVAARRPRRPAVAVAVPKDIPDVDDVWPPPKKTPPDVATQHHSVSSSSFPVDWGIDERLVGSKLEAVVEEMVANSTSEPQTVMLKIVTGE
ncbi:Hypothetical predicted protein [Cloeon dipterum]|uniref:BZIP domain-containing protein n=1 Tax=Cloeon dipterum TaxID=197152 RepID=A0A8S1DHG9_9INSE|nr:Hypothetical predicted protein [Cloeon dipterum]